MATAEKRIRYKEIFEGFSKNQSIFFIFVFPPGTALDAYCLVGMNMQSVTVLRAEKMS